MLDSKKKKLQNKLLRWYQASKRDLPWRKTKDPYAIWVSEIMLQQTQVDTVIPYYKKWLKTFPTLQSLAKAPLEKALGAWAGLGYYRRPKMLHQACKEITEKLKGKMPKTAEALQELPGIGRYTAGAIASIAFNEPAPIVDGNVMRILTRIEGIKDDILQPKTQKKLWQLAEKLAATKTPGDFNQAMMELGALICTPDNPACLVCPVAKECVAKEKNLIAKIPYKAKKQKLEKIKRAALVYENKSGKVLLQQQATNERWGGMWMFPHWDTLKELKVTAGPLKISEKPWVSIQHGFTKYQVTLETYYVRNCQKHAPKIENKRWVPLTELKSYALPAPHQKIAKELLCR